jgi:hypothetical protein
MAKVVQLRPLDRCPEKLSKHEALGLVRRIAQDSKNVFVAPHAKQRQAKHGISRRQIMTCLAKGVITEGPFVNKYGNWQVNVSRLAAGEQITCAVAIEWQDQLVVVTVYPR